MNFAVPSLMVFSFAFSAIAVAEAAPTLDPFPAQPTAEKTFVFDKPKDLPHFSGVLKLSDQRKGVHLEFEGKGLKKGQYRFLATDDCKALQKIFQSPRQSASSFEEIESFETEFGFISMEKNLNGQTLENLQIENKSIALVKIEKKGKKLITCSQ